MHIYAFGSVCRGEVDKQSDIDMLVITDENQDKFDPLQFSIYSYSKISQLWEEGNPFAWHLHLESKLIYAENSIDHLKNMGAPSPYKNGFNDCNKFHRIFLQSKNSINTSNHSILFDLSTAFLAIRNFSTCLSLHLKKNINFSRNSALSVESKKIPIPHSIYQTFLDSRILSTRGIGDEPNKEEIERAKEHLNKISDWMKENINKIEKENS